MKTKRTFQWLLAAGAAVVLSSCVDSYYGGGPGPGPVYEPGYVVQTLPPRYETHVYGGSRYYVYNDVYYRPHGHGYVVVKRPPQAPYRPPIHSGGWNNGPRPGYNNHNNGPRPGSGNNWNNNGPRPGSNNNWSNSGPRPGSNNNWSNNNGPRPGTNNNWNASTGPRPGSSNNNNGPRPGQGWNNAPQKPKPAPVTKPSQERKGRPMPGDHDYLR